MKNQILEKALEVAQNAAVDAGDQLIKYFGNIQPEAKSNTGNYSGDIVTKLDRQIENTLAEKLRLFDPSIGFKGEEFGVRADAPRTWLVDPIDGTTHFVRGLPFCSTMIALVENNRVVMSIVYDFVRKDMYSAIKGKGAYRNNEKLTVSNRTLSQSFLSIETRLENDEHFSLFRNLKKRTNTVQFMTSGFELAMIASGKLEGKIAKNPFGRDWDFAAGSLLVEEAGGKVANIGKRSYDYRNHDFIMANNHVYAELTEGPDALLPIEE